MNIIGCYNVWDDNHILRIALQTIPMIDKVIAISGPYRYFTHDPMAIESINRHTYKLMSQLLGDRLAIFDAGQNKAWVSEIDKRNAYLREAKYVAREGDWLFILDSDELLQVQPHTTLPLLLSSLPDDVDAVTVPVLSANRRTPRPITTPIRLLRYHEDGPRYKYDKTHYHIWRDGKLVQAEWAFNAKDVGIYHAIGMRPPERIKSQDRYYEVVVQQKLEENAEWWQLVQNAEA